MRTRLRRVSRCSRNSGLGSKRRVCRLEGQEQMKGCLERIRKGLGAGSGALGVALIHPTCGFRFYSLVVEISFEMSDYAV